MTADSRLGELQQHMTEAQARSTLAELDNSTSKPAGLSFDRRDKVVKIYWSARECFVTTIDQLGEVSNGSSA